MTDEELAMAYADGELDAVTALRVERRMAAEPALAAAVEAQGALRSRLRNAFAAVADEQVPPRLTAMVESNILPFRARTRAVIWSRSAAALAACLVVGIAIGHYWRTGPIGVSDGQLVAAGSLAKSLDTRLAGGGPLPRPLLSFRDRSGVYCRLFETATIEGIACRGQQGWLLRRTQTPSGKPERGTYRQASSERGQLMAAAQDMMVGRPLDAQAERAARDAGWR